MTTHDAYATLPAQSSGDAPSTDHSKPSVFSRPRIRRAAIAGTAVLGAAGLATGVSLFAASTAVAVTVDGETTNVRAYGDATVADVLDDAGVAVEPRDEVLPRPSASVKPDTEVRVRTADRLPMRVDGVEQTPVVLAHTAGGALAEVGINPETALVSALPSTPIDDVGTLEVSTPRDLAILVDGKRLTVSSPETTTRDVLADAGISPGLMDAVTPGLDARPEPGSTITVSRVTKQQSTRTEEIPVGIQKVDDGDLLRGETRTDRAAVPGAREVVVDQLLYDGTVVNEAVVNAAVTRQPQPGKVRIGTKAPPQPAPAPAPARSSAPASSSNSSGSSGGASSSGGLNWSALAACESGGDPNAYNGAGPYYGLYQFDVQTWRSAGGSGNPSSASAGEQTAVAKRLYASRGDSPWPVCGSRLYR